MKLLLLITILFLTSSCCKSKLKVLQQREKHKAEVVKKHGDILPPMIDEVPDIDECQKNT